MTPHELSILLHHYCSHGAFPGPGGLEGNPADLYNSICTQFVGDGIFAPCAGSSGRENGYEVTPKGRAWLRCILETPQPAQVWVDAAGEVIPER